MAASAIDARGVTGSRARLSGWMVTAASLLVVVGGINFVNGYTLLERRSFLGAGHAVYDNLGFWGWAFIVWGALQLVAGALLFARRSAGRSMGVALATTGLVMWFFMLFVVPFGMLVAVLVNSLILIGLTVGTPEGWGEELE